MSEMEPEYMDELLGITRCARCGQRLYGHIECPFCAVVEPEPKSVHSGKWVYLTACFLTSPLSIYPVVRTDRLNTVEKIVALSGCIMWFGLYVMFL